MGPKIDGIENNVKEYKTKQKKVLDIHKYVYI